MCDFGTEPQRREPGVPMKRAVTNEIRSSGTAVEAAQTKFRQILSEPRTGWRRSVWIFWALLGPGIVATLANNDAGGVIAYAVTGARFGIGLFVPLVLGLAPLSFTIQEMSMRLGAVTQEGIARLALRRYGRFWGYYHISTLAFVNLLILVTEFIGMTAGLTLLGLPLWVGTAGCLLLVGTFVLLTGYWTKERVALLIGALNSVFIVVAAMTRPDLATIARAFLFWTVPSLRHSGIIWYVVATTGNAIAPWMIFFQGSGTIDKGMTSREVRLGRIDLAIGCVIQVIVAAAVIICGAAVYGQTQAVGSGGPADFILALSRTAGHWAAILFAIGLFDAGFLAAITVSLSSSWSIAELLGWSKSLDDRISDAPNFYAIYIGSLVLAALAMLVPHLPLNLIAVAVQVIGGILMTPLVIFMVLMTSDPTLMGAHRTSLPARLWSWALVAALVCLTAAACWSSISSSR